MSDVAYIIIVTVVVVVIIVVSIVWTAVIKTKPELPPPVSEDATGYGMRCVAQPPIIPDDAVPGDPRPQQCGQGLVCTKVRPDDPWGFCKKAIGQVCTSLSECESKAVACSRVCQTTAVGGLDQVCDFSSSSKGECATNDLVCVTGRCKIKPNSSGCFENFDCAQGSCQNGTCLLRLPNGSNCTNNDICQSGNCTGGWCQPVGVKTGDLGAGCFYFKQGKETLPGCNSTASLPLTCYKDLSIPGDLGVCAVEAETWSGIPCTDAAGCIPPTVCQSGKCVMPIAPSDVFLTNSCKQGESSGICSPGYVCQNGECRANVATVPRSSGSPAIFKWNDTLPSSKAGGWTAITGTSGNIDQGSLSAITTTFSDNTIGDLIMYKANGRFLLIRGNRTFEVTPDGPYNGTVKLNKNPALKYRVDHFRFTQGHRLIYFYSWLNEGLRVSRGGIANIPESWLDKTKTPSIVQYQASWPGSVPNTNISVNDPVYIQGGFFSITFTTLDLLTSPIIDFDVDDRPDSQNKFRFLLVFNTSAGRNFAYTLATISEFNAVFAFVAVLGTNYNRARFYSYQKGDHDTDAYLSIDRDVSPRITINGKQVPPIQLPPYDIPSNIKNMALYSTQGGGIASSLLAYIIDAEDFSGGTQLAVYRGFHQILPGYFQANTSLAIPFPNPADKTAKVTTIYATSFTG